MRWLWLPQNCLDTRLIPTIYAGSATTQKLIQILLVSIKSLDGIINLDTYRIGIRVPKLNLMKAKTLNVVQLSENSC